MAAGIQTSKPQLFIDTIFIPKPKRLASHTSRSKRSKSAARQKPAPPTPKPRPSKPRKPALTRQERKAQGLCRCGQAAIQEQTRCPTCAEKHRAWNRQYSKDRRRANGADPRPQTDEQCTEQFPKELAAQETGAASTAPKRVLSKAYNQERAQYQQRLRSERKSLDLCVQCAEQVLKARPAVTTASLNTASMNCAAERKPSSLLNNRAGKGTPQPDDYDTSSISDTLDSSTPDVEP